VRFGPTLCVRVFVLYIFVRDLFVWSVPQARMTTSFYLKCAMGIRKGSRC